MDAVNLRGVRKTYGGRTVLDIESLEIREREFFVLVGPSGSGKTTLLRILAGLVRPDCGEVRLRGQEVTGRPPHERAIGLVFQGLALWPHLSVKGNLALGLGRVVPDASERRERIRSVSAELDIERFLDSRPGRLSGGERQRVALARALLRRPALLLLDEPFSDLDARLRRSTARLVRRLHDEHAMATMLITHDRTDAYLLADRIGLVRDGRLVACGAPDELHAAPRSAFAAEFLTDAALLRGQATGSGQVHTALGPLPLAGSEEGAVLVAVRPDEIRLGQGATAGVVIACEFAGGPWRCRIRVGEVEVAAHSARPLGAGEPVLLAPPSAARTALREDR